MNRLGDSQASPPSHLGRGLILLTLFLLPIRSITVLASGTVNVGFLAAVGLIPFLAIRKFPTGAVRWLAVVLLAAIGSAPVLMQHSIAVGRLIDAQAALNEILVVVKAACIAIVSYISSRREGLRRTAIAFNLGLCANYATQLEGISVNPWKYGFALPASLVLLAVLSAGTRVLPLLAGLSVLGVITVFFDYRSFWGFLALTGLLLVLRRHGQFARSSLRMKLILLSVAALFVYSAVVNLALSGYLGERNRLVTAEQLRSGGSLLSAGRLEWHVSLALFSETPWGYGPGFIPGWAERGIAYSSLMKSGLPYDARYVEGYLMGKSMELHSIAADLWAQFGLLGLLASSILLGILVSGLVRALDPECDSAAVMILCTLISLWDLAFSPLPTNLPGVAFALGAVVAEARSRHHESPDLSLSMRGNRGTRMESNTPTAGRLRSHRSLHPVGPGQRQPVSREGRVDAVASVKSPLHLTNLRAPPLLDP